MAVTTKTEEPLEILLIEDSEADIELARIGLRSGGGIKALHVASDGYQAMRFLRREGEFQQAPVPDVILLDLNLPGMDGRELMTELRSDPALSGIPVVVLTASDAPFDIAQAYDNFASAYMTKPVAFEQFRRIMYSLSDELFAVVRSPGDAEPPTKAFGSC